MEIKNGLVVSDKPDTYNQPESYTFFFFFYHTVLWTLKPKLITEYHNLSKQEY